jgi:(4S)-4-hydroxy-5-phosphonooxypentane-2,3-dione isomerase
VRVIAPLDKMPLTLVHVQVKPECIEAFKAATMDNVAQSRQEFGVLQFDLCQQADDPARFVILEGYQTVTAMTAHKDTAHYKKWRDAAADMMAVPRVGVRYEKLDSNQ